MPDPQPAYTGRDRYVFVCYAHADKAAVYPEIAWLQSNGVHVWYDEGISPGSEWTEDVAAAIKSSRYLLFFGSPASVATRHCRNELHYAAEYDKPIVTVYLEPTQLPAGLQLSIGSVQALQKYRLSDQVYREKLRSTLASPYALPRFSESPRTPSNLQAQLIEKLFSSIAVFSLDNRTGKSEFDTLGDEVAECLTDALARLGYIASGFRLVGRRETAKYRHSDAQDIARSLDVGGILRGAFRRAGDDARITIELANARGDQVWRTTFHESFDLLVTEPDRLADKIVSGVLYALDQYGLSQVKPLASETLGPIGLFFKAKNTSMKGGPEAERESRQMMERAIELNPHILMCKAVLASRLALAVASGRSSDREADSQRAIELADEVSASDAATVLMHAGLAFSSLREHDRGAQLCRLAHELAPRHVSITWALAGTLLYAGYPDEALQYYRDAESASLPEEKKALQPGIAQCQLAIGDPDAAVETASRLIVHGPRDLAPYTTLASALADLGRLKEAMEVVENAKRLEPRFTLTKSIRAIRRQFGNEAIRNAMTRGLQLLVDHGLN